MPKISIVRGAFLNPFELQNYYPLVGKYDFEVFSSKFPLSDKIELPLTKLWSPTDLPNFPYKYPILNRVYVDCQRLALLEHHLSNSDIVHVAETYYGYTQQAALLKQQKKINKLVSTVWETIPFNNEGIRGRKEYKKLAYSQIDKYICVTKRSANALIKEGVSQNKISQLYMGVDIHRFSPKPKKQKSAIRILTVSRLVEEKGVSDLVTVFHKLQNEYKRLHLTIVGDGPLKSELINHKNISIKKVPYSEIHRVYQDADIFCLASHTTKYWEEQFGMCLVEAMASGLPIVASSSGAIPEVCDNKAIIFREKNQSELYSALKELIYNQDIRNEMSKQSRDLAIEKYNSQKQSLKIDAVYQEILCQ